MGGVRNICSNHGNGRGGLGGGQWEGNERAMRSVTIRGMVRIYRDGRSITSVGGRGMEKTVEGDWECHKRGNKWRNDQGHTCSKEFTEVVRFTIEIPNFLNKWRGSSSQKKKPNQHQIKEFMWLAWYHYNLQLISLFSDRDANKTKHLQLFTWLNNDLNLEEFCLRTHDIANYSKLGSVSSYSMQWASIRNAVTKKKSREEVWKKIFNTAVTIYIKLWITDCENLGKTAIFLPGTYAPQ